MTERQDLGHAETTLVLCQYQHTMNFLGEVDLFSLVITSPMFKISVSAKHTGYVRAEIEVHISRHACLLLENWICI